MKRTVVNRYDILTTYKIAVLVVRTILHLISPFFLIWSVNTLFHTEIPVAFKTWLGGLLLLSLLRINARNSNQPGLLHTLLQNLANDNENEDEDGEEEDDDTDEEEIVDAVVREERMERLKAALEEQRRQRQKQEEQGKNQPKRTRPR